MVDDLILLNTVTRQVTLVKRNIIGRKMRIILLTLSQMGNVAASAKGTPSVPQFVCSQFVLTDGLFCNSVPAKYDTRYDND